MEHNDPDGGLMQLIPMIVLWALIIPPLWRIAKRAGFNPWLSLLMFIPFVNIVALWIFSRKPWPAMNKTK